MKKKSFREQAFGIVTNYSDEYILGLIGRRYRSGYEYLVITDDGMIETYYDDESPTQLYYEYPNKPLECIYTIHSNKEKDSTIDYHNLVGDAKSIMELFNSMDKENFVKKYGESFWQYCKDYERKDQ